MNNLVSIITPVYNSAKFLESTIDSVLAQTYTNWEHILVDDCSTDDSADIIKRYRARDSRIVYIKLAKNSGAGIARNTAIKAAKGDYIAFLDSDDQWYRQKLERQLHFMRKNDYNFTFTDYDILIDDNEKTNITIQSGAKVTYKRALYNNPIGCLTVIYNVKFFGKQYFPNVLKCEDYALWLRLLSKTDGYGLNECLSSYRKRSDSVSANKFDLIQYVWHIYRKVAKLSMIYSFFYSFSTIFLKLKQIFVLYIMMNFKVSKIGNLSKYNPPNNSTLS